MKMMTGQATKTTEVIRQATKTTMMTTAAAAVKMMVMLRFLSESVTTDVSNNITHHCADEDSDTTGETEVASSSVQDTGITVNEEAQDSVQGHSKHFIG